MLVHPANPDQVCGVLDFGDMLHGPRVFDAAVAASYQCHALGQPRMEGLFEFMRGYQLGLPWCHAEHGRLLTLARGPRRQPAAGVHRARPQR